MKRTIAAVCLLMAAGSVFAQSETTEQTANSTETVEYSNDKFKVETNRFWNNWFISVGAGAQIYFGDHDKQVKFGQRLAPNLDVSFGKWFTPGIGVRVMYSGLKAKGATQKGALAHSTGEDVPEKGGNGYWLEKQKFDMGNIHADVLFNFSNLFCGYNPKRVWNCSPYIGVGFGMVYNSPSAKELTANVGLLNTFRLCDALDLNLDIRNMFTSDRFDGEDGGRFGESMISASVGLTYKFKQRGWDRTKSVVRTIYNTEELDAMRDRLNRMSEENARLKEELAKGNQQTVVKHITSSSLIIFPIGKSTLSNQARVNLGMLAEVIKQGDKSANYTITGYADAATGSKKLNERLSKERAEAVYDCLVDEFGVDKSQLSIDYKGGVENMFYDDPRMSRAVITKSK